MSVLLETSLGDIVIDLYVEKAPLACTNFLKLCKAKRYNYALFHTVTPGFTAQTGGDSTGDRDAGCSVWGLDDATRRFFRPEFAKKLKHNGKGVVSFACTTVIGSEDRVASSQFFFTLSETGADYLNNQHAVFGHVVEGLDVLDALNTQLVDDDNRPFRDIRIKHTIVLDDPFPDPPSIPAALLNPARSPSPPADMLRTARIGEDEDVLGTQDDGEAEKAARDREAAARALTLEMIGDLPFAEIRPPENILFVCKLNPITRDEDLELIFSRFGEIRSCEIIRDKKTQDSLCYAFIDFEEKESAEDAYFKMDNVLVDDRRIHVDFSQSVSKLHQDFMVGKQQQRKKLGDGQEFGGTGLQKRRQYRDDEDEDENDDDGKRKGERGGERSGGRGYALVFDHDGTLEREKKRVREKSDVGSAGRDNGGRKRKDDEEEERRFEKISTSGSSQRRDEERHYYSERSNRNGSGGGLRKGDYSSRESRGRDDKRR